MILFSSLLSSLLLLLSILFTRPIVSQDHWLESSRAYVTYLASSFGIHKMCNIFQIHFHGLHFIVLWCGVVNSLQLHHNERDGVSNHRRLGCFHNCMFKRRSKKTSKLRATDLCEGYHKGPVTRKMWPADSPHKGPVTRKMFPFDDVIMYRFSPFPSGLLHWLRNNCQISLVTVKQPWRIWGNKSYGSTRNL